MRLVWYNKIKRVSEKGRFFFENKKSTVFYAFGCDAERKYKFNTGKCGAGALR